MTLTRDSLLWWIVAAGAVLGYLATAQKPPTQWSYSEWIQAGIAGVGWLSGKLAASPLQLSFQGQAKMNAGQSYRDIPAPTTPPNDTLPTTSSDWNKGV